MTSLSLLLVTIGRDTLGQMLESIIPQLEAGDYLTVISDGINPRVNEICEQYRHRLRAELNIIQHPENLGYWGHPIRNIYQTKLPGDFILHCDDDDIYMPGALQSIRSTCTDKSKLYMFRMILDHRRKISVWRHPRIEVGNIGTPQGIIPNRPEIMGEWINEIGGDGQFYLETERKIGVNNVIFCNNVIYCVRPHVLGWPAFKK